MQGSGHSEVSMGDVKNRGSKDRPQWYCRYIDVDGKRKHRPTHQPTKALAMRFVAEVEARVARGLVGIPDATSPERQGKALTLLALAERFMHEANPPTKNPERYRQWFRYTMAKRDEWEAPKQDIERLRALGVNDYQVDSRYQPLFR